MIANEFPSVCQLITKTGSPYDSYTQTMSNSNLKLNVNGHWQGHLVMLTRVLTYNENRVTIQQLHTYDMGRV